MYNVPGRGEAINTQDRRCQSLAKLLHNICLNKVLPNMSNFIGTLKEKLDRFHGITTPPKYVSSPVGTGFECRLSFSMTRLYSDPREFSATSEGSHSSKKGAEQSAASVMLSTVSFVNFYNGIAETSGDFPLPPVGDNLSESVTAVPSAIPIVVSTPPVVISSAVTNSKGLLLEKIAKHAPGYEATFQHTAAGPFVSQVTVKRVQGTEGDGRELTVAGPSAATKKQADQLAASLMLDDSGFQALCAASAVTSHQRQPAPANPILQPTVEVMGALDVPSLSSITEHGPQPAAPVQQVPSTFNAKGALLEKVAQMNPQRRAVFDTSLSGPFTCTVRIENTDISATGGPCSTKKLAEWQAAAQMLQHELFGGSAVQLSPGLHSTAGAGLLFAAPTVVPSVVPSTAPSVTAHGVPDGLSHFSHASAAPELAATLSFPSPSIVSSEASPANDFAPVPTVATLSAAAIAQVRDARSPSVSSQPSTCGSVSSAVNYKGMLQEKLVTMLSRPTAKYESTINAPFVCTLTISTACASQSATSDSVSVRSDGRPSKKAAEQHAAELMLQHPFVARDIDRSVDCLADQTVKCARCKTQIGTIADFMFYDKTEVEVQFALKPEAAILLAASLADPSEGHQQGAPEKAVPRITILPSEPDPSEPAIKAKCKVVCNYCQYSLGVQMATGPDSTSLTSFGNNKVVVKGRHFTSSENWQKVSEDPAFGDIEHRTEATFYGSDAAQSGRTTRQSFNYLPVQFPKLHDGSFINSEDYQYADLLSTHCKKEIKTEQLQAFHQALQQNMAIVFPTGFGKTFVASLIMHRFRILNPKKLAVMIVDRIPLVDQQSKAIHHDTGLLVCPLSSENSTRYIVGELINGKYDALVVTAGALHNYLRDGSLCVSDFSVFVFDECHHVVGEHMYTHILQMIAQCPTRLQSRVVGLTASPFSAKSNDSAETKLHTMLTTLCDADIYCPKILNVTTQEIVRHPVLLSERQNALQEALTRELKPLVERLCAHFKLNGLFERLIGTKPFKISVPCNRADWLRATNLSAETHFASDGDGIKAVAAQTREVLRALKDNYLLGPHFVRRSAPTASAPNADDTPEPHSDPASAVISAQMAELCTILTGCGPTACILVFVDERHTAKQLLRYLSERFPHLGCQKLIGQGGFDGMRWKGAAGQGAILQTFRSGETKLIVCTSVLEEGLDVKVCERVIRLGGAPSLIQVIQSKGRARDKAGRLDLICTVEEQDHFDNLLKEEALLDSVLRNRANGQAGHREPDYIADFMQSCAVRGKPRDCDDDACSDDGSVTSVDSDCSTPIADRKLTQKGDAGTGGEEAAESGDYEESRSRNYGLQMLLCSEHEALEEMVKNTLQLQSLFIDCITKLHIQPRAARSVVSDPRMFRSGDSLALVAVSSEVHSFLRTFCSVWDFRVNDAPVYLLAHPSNSAKPAEETARLPTSPDNLRSAEASNVGPVSTLGGVLGVSCGHFVSRQSFMQVGELGCADRAKYTRVHVEQDKSNTLVLEGTLSESMDRVLISIPATILAKSAVVSADRAEKTLTVFFTVTSTPAVYLQPSARGDKGNNTSAGNNSLRDSMRSDCRVFCASESVSGASQGASSGELARADLRLLASCPVIAVTFRLTKWRRVMKLFTNPAVLGLSVLITRVIARQYTGDQSHQSLPILEDAHQGDQVTVPNTATQPAKECQWTYAALASDVYCSALNPAVLQKIKEVVLAALTSGSEVRIGTVTAAVQQLQMHLKQCFYWEDTLEYFTSALSSLEAGAMRREQASATLLSLSSAAKEAEELTSSTDAAAGAAGEYVMMPRVLATPSRLVVTAAVHTKSNRLIRMLGSKYRLVYVKFRDEQGQGLFSEHIYEGRYKQMFIQGFELCGRRYHFLLSSASQLREQTAVFFDGSLTDVLKIRDFLIPDKSKFVGDEPKYISRLGLFCTADSDTGLVLSDVNSMVEDDTYTRGERKKILTDGAGRISSRFMRKIFNAEGEGYYPSCVQIRAIGCKGILLEDPQLDTEHPGMDVVFRNSMRKFETECHTTLCIVKAAEFNPVTLNREVINLLCAIRDHASAGTKKWSPHNTLVALQDEELNRLGQMLVDPVCAIDSLSEHYPRKVLQSLVQSGLNILSEPHFMSLLHLQYYHASRALRRKTHIPILHGTLAMGAPDPTGMLRDGEISIVIHRAVHRYAGCFDEATDEYRIGGVTLIRVKPPAGSSENDISAGGYETFVVTGPVAFYRNPCLDPGDLRVVTAVYRPELLHWKNVVLLPASADHCQRSLSAECSGGDLDGDTFGILWDPRLVPPTELGSEAVDYEELARQAKQERGAEASAGGDGADELSRIADFVARTMCNCNLGRIANLHLALCDQLVRQGAGAPLARKLAEAQSLAVDYAKTGIPPVIPSEARKLVRQHGYPHFMENDRKPSYPSFQSLGTLYNITSSVACTVAFAGADREFLADMSFAVPGWEEYRGEAQESYEQFEREAKGLMLRYGLESDAELVLGLPYKWSDEFELDHAAAAESLAAAWAALRDRCKRLFYSSLPDNNSDCKLRKACAWYHASYSDKSHLHSFAWIVFQELALVKEVSGATASIFETHQLLGDKSWPVHDAVSIAVGKGALHHWEKQRAQLVHALSIKEQQFAKIRVAILSSAAVQALPPAMLSNISIELFGSAALLLCDFLSDIDICISLPQLCAETVLKDLVKPGVSAVAETCHYIAATIPLVRITVEDGHMSVPVDISAQNKSGVYKSSLIRHLYLANPTYLLLFSSIVQWARCCGLLRGFAAEKRQALLNSGQMQALIVRFLLQRHPAAANLDETALEDANGPGTNVRILAGVASSDAYALELGQLLLSFFMMYSQWSSAAGTSTGEESAGPAGRSFDFSWPVPDSPSHSVGATSMEEVGQCCRRALHCLAVSRSWSYLLEYCIAFERARTSLELELSVSLSRIIGPARAFHEMWLRCKSQASDVHIVESKADPSRLVVHATGRYQQIQVLRQELLTLIYTGRLHSYGSIRSMASAYFMEGSSFLYAAGTDSKATMLQARALYVDRYLLRHAHGMKELSTLSMCGSYKRANEVWKAAFKTEFRAKVTEQLSHLSRVKKDEQVLFSVHLGKMVLLDAARTFERSRGALSASDMETAMDSARNIKISTYGAVKSDDQAAGSAKATAKPGANNKSKVNTPGSSSRNSGDHASAKVKNNLASTFVSAIPIFADASARSPGENALIPYSEYTDNITRVTGKLQSVLNGLGYDEYTPGDPHDAIRIPGTTLTLPPAGWRVAVELSERQQLHVDLDAEGHVAAVSDRFLSWVNGTVVTPVDIDLGPAPADLLEPEATPPSAAAGGSKALTYDFKDHDLRFKIGTVKAIAESSPLHELACPGGSSPIKLTSLDEHIADNANDGVDSNLTSEFAQSVHTAEQAFTFIRASPLMKRPDMVSFARHVIQRRAFLQPSAAKVKVMAVMAVGNCYEGARLCVVNPFVDVSLEVDATGLLRCLGNQVVSCAGDDDVATASADDTDGGEMQAVSDPLALGDLLDSICDEILRVSDRIREVW